MARKVLKGADPAEKLMWKTPEVCLGLLRSAIKGYGPEYGVI